MADAHQDPKIMVAGEQRRRSSRHLDGYLDVLAAPEQDHRGGDCGELDLIGLINVRHEYVTEQTARAAIVDGTILLASALDSSIAHKAAKVQPTQ
jgi:hypothetical protein